MTKRDKFIEWWFEQADRIRARPYPYQLRILSEKRIRIINKARQTGISTAVACLAVMEAALGNRHVLIVSNKDDAAKHIVEYAWSFIHVLIDYQQIEAPEVDQQGFIRWSDGGEIRCQAASENAGRGFDIHLAILDEAAHFVKEIDLDRRIYRSVVPTLKPDGRMIVLSTPRGTKNLFYDLWEETPEENRLTIHWTECPDLVNKVRIEELPFGKRYWVRDQPFDEADFRQEFENDFFVGSDEAIPLEALRAAIVEQEPPPNLTFKAFGVDIGYEHDATAIVVMGIDDSGNVWIVELVELRRSPFDEQEAALSERQMRHSPGRIVMDRTFNPQSTENARVKWPHLVEPFVFTEQSKRDLLAKASSFFTMGKVKCPMRYRQAIDEIANIKKVIGPSGSILFKDKPHGDIGWAGLLALWGMPKGRIEVSDETMIGLGAIW